MGFLKKALSLGKKEQKVAEKMRSHIRLLCSACDSFKNALEADNRHAMRDVADLEREGDSIRREIISDIYDGAFLPYFRSDLCKFVEVVDCVFDAVKNTASYYCETRLPEELREECIQVALLNVRICEMLFLTFEAMSRGEDLREKTLAIRIYEKKVDDIKLALYRGAKTVAVDGFWEGKVLADFISGLTSISDIIEDASDHLQIILVTMM
jgi:predicted phosphate transport protein (TIGR00153 family)